MSMHSQTAGRPHTVARRATGGRASAAEPKGTEETPVEVRDRKQREEVGKEKKKVEVMVQNPVDVKDPAESPGRTRNAAIVYEAMDLLRSFGYVPARISELRILINIIAMKKTGSLFVCALRFRLPVPSAAKLRELFRGRVDCLCTMVHHVRERIMIWVYSPACGWRYYLVFPGGLRYDPDFPASLG